MWQVAHVTQQLQDRGLAQDLAELGGGEVTQNTETLASANGESFWGNIGKMLELAC
jgi:hypothetical protein